MSAKTRKRALIKSVSSQDEDVLVQTVQNTKRCGHSPVSKKAKVDKMALKHEPTESIEGINTISCTVNKIRKTNRVASSNKPLLGSEKRATEFASDVSGEEEDTIQKEKYMDKNQNLKNVDLAKDGNQNYKELKNDDRDSKGSEKVIFSSGVSTKGKKTVLKDRFMDHKQSIDCGKDESQNYVEQNIDDSDSLSDLSDEENGGISAYERRRQDNIRKNTEFLSTLGVKEASLVMKGTARAPRKRQFKKREFEKLPLRPKSLRLQRKDPEGAQLPIVEQPKVELVDRHPRKARGSLLVKDVSNDDVDEAAFSETFETLAEMDVWTRGDASNGMNTDVVKQMSQLQLREEKVVKCVKDRIFSLAVHPNTERLLVVAGDKWGQLGFWDVNSSNKLDNGGICVYTPHARPVNCLQFSRINTGKLYSCSYDGSLRCCHFELGQFDELYRTSDEYEERCMGFDLFSSDQLLIGRDDGRVVKVDNREKSSNALAYEVLGTTVKCISIHPQQMDYFIVSDNRGDVNLYDLRTASVGRKMKSIETLPHGRSVNSAYFSPITGNYILTTSMNDTVCIYDSSNSCKIENKCMIKHDNHTGRWLTGFRAVWHPAREDIFAVGSMFRPRQIDLYNSSGEKFHVLKNEDWLGSVCSINVIHPTMNAVIGGNSSGRLHAFL